MTGNGPFSFETEYMMEQARYFVAHPTSSYIQLADNITQPFNEYLHLFIRFGFMGLVLLSAIAWMTFKRCEPALHASNKQLGPRYVPGLYVPVSPIRVTTRQFGYC